MVRKYLVNFNDDFKYLLNVQLKKIKLNLAK